MSGLFGYEARQMNEKQELMSEQEELEKIIRGGIKRCRCGHPMCDGIEPGSFHKTAKAIIEAGWVKSEAKDNKE